MTVYFFSGDEDFLFDADRRYRVIPHTTYPKGALKMGTSRDEANMTIDEEATSAAIDVATARLTAIVRDNNVFTHVAVLTADVKLLLLYVAALEGVEPD